MRYFNLWAIFICLMTISHLSALEVPMQPSPQMTQPSAKNLLEATLNYARAHQEFRELHFKPNEQEFVRLVQEGQNPHTLFIGCSDSRVVPDLILRTRPGDLFVIRTAGNFVPLSELNDDDGVSATLQYAIEALGIRHIIVCGHSHCGAIEGLFQPLDNKKFDILKRWLRFGEEAKQTTLMAVGRDVSKEQLYSVAERISVIYQLEHLMSFPFVRERVQNGSVILHGWYYKIETGEVEYYDPDDMKFKSLTALMENKRKS